MPTVLLSCWNRRWQSATIWLVLSLNCALLPCLSAEHSGLQESPKNIPKAKTFLPECLQQLLTADSFEDSARGESPDLPKNYATYLAAAKLIPKLVTENLLYVRDHALPAGRIYAAILLKQSGQTDALSFGKLLNDTTPVKYVSGCKGTQTTVADVAHGFIEKGRFLNFALANYCTLPPPLDSPAAVQATCLASLMSQNTVQHYELGDSNKPSDAWRAFHLLLTQGKNAKPAALSLAESKSGGARIYGAVLLHHIDAAEGKKLLKSWLGDKKAVCYSWGCEKEDSTVGALSERLLKGEELILLTDPRTKKH